MNFGFGFTLLNIDLLLFPEWKVSVDAIDSDYYVIIMSFRYKDYVRLKEGGYHSVGKFGDDIYAYEVLTGFTDTPEYHQISKAEFDSFEVWGRSDNMDMQKFYEIAGRPVLCSGYLGKAELDTSLLQYL